MSLYLICVLVLAFYVPLVFVIAKATGFSSEKTTPVNNFTITGPYKKRAKRARSAWLD